MSVVEEEEVVTVAENAVPRLVPPPVRTMISDLAMAVDLLAAVRQAAELWTNRIEMAQPMPSSVSQDPVREGCRSVRRLKNRPVRGPARMSTSVHLREPGSSAPYYQRWMERNAERVERENADRWRRSVCPGLNDSDGPIRSPSPCSDRHH